MKSRIKRILQKCISWIRSRRGEILYYGCVLAALAVIAVGAQEYRQTRTEPAPVSLPAVEIALPEAREAEFCLPEDLRRIRPYSAEPQWNAQDLSWQAHPAADYACEGGVIRAISDGTILEVGKSAVLGGYVLIESGEVQLKYCSIIPEEKLQPGKNIRMGDALGAAANAMPGEMHLGEHLHLEAWRQGEQTDPETLMQTAD